MASKYQTITVCSDNGDEYIEYKDSEWFVAVVFKQFYYKIDTKENVITCENHGFSANIRFTKRELFKLEGNFQNVKKEFLRQIKITDILTVKLCQERNKAFEYLNYYITALVDTDLDISDDVFQVWKFVLEKQRDCALHGLLGLQKLSSSPYISPKLHNIITILIDKETAFQLRAKRFPVKVDEDWTLEALIDRLLLTLREDCLRSHRQTLLYRCSNWLALTRNVEIIPKEVVLLVKIEDVALFSDMWDITEEGVFLDFLTVIQEQFFRKIESTFKSVKDFASLTNHIYFYLYKTFRQILIEISELTDIPLKDLLVVDTYSGSWRLEHNVGESIKGGSSFDMENQPVYISLKQSMYFIDRLMSHHQPGLNCRTESFDYKYKNLTELEHHHAALIDKPLEALLGRSVATNQWLRIWAYFIDDSASYFCRVTDSYSSTLYHVIFKGFLELIGGKPQSEVEEVRMTAIGIVKFLSRNDTYLDFDIGSELEESIYREQLGVLSYRIWESPCVSDIRELIESFNHFWRCGELICGHSYRRLFGDEFSHVVESLSEELMSLVKAGTHRSVRLADLIQFYRDYTNFVTDISEIDFKWYVKGDVVDDVVETCNRGILKSDGRETQPSGTEFFLVVKPADFIEELKEQGRVIPPHILLDGVPKLVETVRQCLATAPLMNNPRLRASWIVGVSGQLMSFIRCALLYMREYDSFDSLFQVIKNILSMYKAKKLTLKEFHGRVNILRDSFWYILHQHELGIERALEKYNELNGGIDKGEIAQLKNSYEQYLVKFNEYISKTGGLTFKNRVNFIVDHMKKKNGIVNVLAGVSSVWSLWMSRDLFCNDKLLKPHCVQILCILKLFRFNKVIYRLIKHLCKVLTGQGKSLILGLMSAVMAMMSYDVKLVCYRKKRDKHNFQEFFKLLGIQDRISYWTFEDMCDSILTAEYEGKKSHLCHSEADVKILEDYKFRKNRKSNKFEKTVLLIDEVDIFISDWYYGTTHGSSLYVFFEAIVKIQERIWELVKKMKNFYYIKRDIEKLFETKYEGKDRDFKVLSGLYDERNRWRLFTEQLDLMIANALDVHRNGTYAHLYKLDSKGRICCRGDNGVYLPNFRHSYLNVFHYFRLKGSDYSHENHHNYGYLQVNRSLIAYSRLPEKYPIILGVSGTLSMADYDESIKYLYPVWKVTTMPSFFGPSNLKFCEKEDVFVVAMETDWLTKIRDLSDCATRSRRSVIIFFATHQLVTQFANRFGDRYRRCHVMTEETKQNLKLRYMDEAGLSGTVTVATRGMARGVAYRSSASVESHGGVHVIQTFFSHDDKEETQIRGRTAREGNKGSYQLVLCQEHLIREGWIDYACPLPTDYASLCAKRRQLPIKKGKGLREKLRSVSVQHDNTVTTEVPFGNEDVSDQD